MPIDVFQADGSRSSVAARGLRAGARAEYSAERDDKQSADRPNRFALLAGGKGSGSEPERSRHEHGRAGVGHVVKSKRDRARSDAGLERGANSFTEGQARRRIEDHGYTNVSQLHK